MTMMEMAAVGSEDTAPSSTPTRAVFSSDGIDRREGTPSSSPPCFPWELGRETTSTKPDRARSDAEQKTASPLKRPVRNAFSILGKRKPLEATTDNARPPSKLRKSNAKDKDDESQMQMSLGQAVQKKCSTCGMEYTASSAEDRKLHDKYHKQNLEGYDVGKDFVSRTKQWRKHYGVFPGVKAGDTIVYLDCFDHGKRKNRGQAVLNIVQRELGAVPIPEPQIWDLKAAQYESDRDVKYKAYLYIRGTKCVGFLLVQKIGKAYRVTRPAGVQSRAETTPAAEDSTPGKGAVAALKARKQRETATENAIVQEMEEAAQHQIHLSNDTHPAVIGISRIWTSSTVRGQGIAKRLIEVAIKRHNIMAVDNAREKADWEVKGEKTAASLCGHVERIEHKEEVAFSQPTDAGAKLARKWYGRAYGWSVYLE
ncbi:N-acetyltransferase eso1 [Pseudocercospora fuligena]|uniref:N-acetyltransferase eso1 n=1 Tax=Pseudocercospora fuligena TaxID=685502 RepID=A0A8H6RS10_9PEZI|nr:N-acetyltransferase eso1 [Pseudocercospora fuligena]